MASGEVRILRKLLFQSYHLEIYKLKLIYCKFEISGKEKISTLVNATNVNSRGGCSQYQNGGNGQRGGYYNYSRYQKVQNGANGQRGVSQCEAHNGYNSRKQNGFYRGKSSSRSSNATDDGASDKAERSSVKSERYLCVFNFLNYYTFLVHLF
jgi:hypothetical protein